MGSNPTPSATQFVLFTYSPETAANSRVGGLIFAQLVAAARAINLANRQFATIPLCSEEIRCHKRICPIAPRSVSVPLSMVPKVVISEEARLEIRHVLPRAGKSANLGVSSQLPITITLLIGIAIPFACHNKVLSVRFFERLVTSDE